MGKRPNDRSLITKELEKRFPKLNSTNWKPASEFDPYYNCVSFAAGDTKRKWEFLDPPGYYWPPNVDEGDELTVLIKCFESLGYEKCDNGNPEKYYEKVALYGFVDRDDWQHAAYRKGNDWWASKIGELEDILHKSESLLEGESYGSVYCYLKRRIPNHSIRFLILAVFAALIVMMLVYLVHQLSL